MRVVTWNVNSIRARLEHLAQVVDRLAPDVLLLQETRCTDSAFPHSLLNTFGYDVAHHGYDHRNGVAIASRVGLDAVQVGFPDAPPAPFDTARIISATCSGIRFHSVYVPNGRTLVDPQYTYKLEWLERLCRLLATELGRVAPNLFVAGDFNIAPADIDIYDPSRFRRTTHASAPERAAIRSIEALGMTDLQRAHDSRPDLYTWWNYAPGQAERNRGMRIDLAFADAGLQPFVRRVDVDRVTRALPKASDHAPVIIDLDWPNRMGRQTGAT